MNPGLTNGASGALAIAAAVRSGQMTATQAVEDALACVAATDGAVNAFTAVLAERALAQARDLDSAIAAGKSPGPLAGVPYAVKNLFDVEGLPTIAGSRIRASAPPAGRDAMLIRQMTAAGAVLIGTLNMDEFAFGFSTQNSHYGATRNPHASDRIAGGSSGGSAAAVAAGMVPIALGSDTNGSIRVPAALCGVFGLKPTFGRLGRSGTQLFSASLDHVGPFARSVDDLAAVYDLLQGSDADDAVSVARPLEPVVSQLERPLDEIRIGVAAGYFEQSGTAESFAAVATVAAALGVTRRVQIPDAAAARAAAMIVTASEGAELHLDELRGRLAEFDVNTRHLFLAGAMVPAAWYVHAQRFRRKYCAGLARLFEEVDVILAPATPYPAFSIGQGSVRIGETDYPASPHLGVYTQPLSFAGLPVIAAPVANCGALPLGIQIVAAPWREDLVFRVAKAAERAGVVAPYPKRISNGDK